MKIYLQPLLIAFSSISKFYAIAIIHFQCSVTILFNVLLQEIQVLLRLGASGNTDELQIEHNKSVDRPGRVRNPDGPYTRGPLGYRVIEKGTFDHLGAIAVKYAYAVVMPKSLV